MDTNVKKWTKALWVRLLCFALSLVMFTAFAGLLAYTVRQAGVFGENIFLSRQARGELSFTDTNVFVNELREDLLVIAGKTGSYREQMIREQAMESIDKYAKAFEETYRSVKAAYIRSYIFEALCQEDIYDNYADYFNVEANLSVPMITIEQRVLVDAYAPEFVQNVQKILNGTDGTGFLRHSDLIPAEQLAAQIHDYDVLISADYFSAQRSFDYTLDLTDPSAYFVNQYTLLCEQIAVGDYYTHETVPSAICYYIKDPQSGEVFTNCSGSEAEILADWKTQGARLSILDGRVQQSGLELAEKNDIFKACFNEALDVYVSVDLTEATADDKYLGYFEEFCAFAKQDFVRRIIIMVLLALGALIFLIFLLILSVRRRLWIDRLPPDLHLLISGGMGALLIAFGLNAVSSLSSGWLYDYRWQSGIVIAVFMAAAAVGWSLVCEFLCSLVRIAKCGALAESLLLLRFPKFLWRQGKTFWDKVMEAFAYEAGAMRRYIFPLLAAWIGVSAILAFVAVAMQSIVLFVLLIVLQAVVAYKFAEYLSRLDRVILAAQNRSDYEGKVEELPASLRTLLQTQKLTEEELKNAIEKAVRDERTKAELITNVSHDLKTPLTGIISYVDLLGKCDIEDEKAGEYLAVLTEKSARLKRLIEDLIEASKVSTGNITIEKTELSLTELAGQAIVEVEKELEGEGLTLVYNPTAQPTVYADGAKIYRVLENLLSNARKYSLAGSRVYALVYEDEEFGYFELKNTSKAPLDISPAELTERFVRGDRSRSEEGNGLGLSIADDLCRLNGGELKLSIDGDLFKAIVKLPKK